MNDEEKAEETIEWSPHSI